jgi:uncharacterized protein involved in exopolysaccharide biosynthesis
MATKGKPPAQAPSQAKGKAKPVPQITPGQIESLQAALKRKEAKTRGEILDRIVEALRIGANPDAAAAYAGISRSTYYNWRKDDPVFAEECEQAIAAAEVQLLMEIRSETSWQAKAWILERRWKDRWGRESRPEAGQDGTKVVLTWGDEDMVAQVQQTKAKETGS